MTSKFFLALNSRFDINPGIYLVKYEISQCKLCSRNFWRKMFKIFKNNIPDYLINDLLFTLIFIHFTVDQRERCLMFCQKCYFSWLCLRLLTVYSELYHFLSNETFLQIFANTAWYFTLKNFTFLNNRNRQKSIFKLSFRLKF
jgi:hypothetical protein